jgi:menaquinone-dependent protoporphyrinogen oxidase
MTSILILYMSRGGHTARIARRLCDSIANAGGRAEMMDLVEAAHEGVDWSRYDVVALGAPVLYGKYDASVMDFIARHRAQLEARPNSFFNVSVVARTPGKSTVTGNRYMQKFLLIMKMTHGPTDTKAVIDYTDWDDVRAYGEHLLTLR